MPDKEPVLLTVLIETAQLRWYVAGIDLAGGLLPLLASEPGNLSPYLGIPFDDQVNFLRHRLSGVLQRGCDRLWGRQKKPCHIVFVADGPFTGANVELTRRIAEHMVEWMTRPPVVFFITARGFAAEPQMSEPQTLERVAGDLDNALRTALDTGLTAFRDAATRRQAWEAVPTPKKT